MAENSWTPYTYGADDLQYPPALDFSLHDMIFDFSSSENESQPQISENSSPSSSSQPEEAPVASGVMCANNECGCGRHFRRRSDLKKHVDQRTRPYPCTQIGCSIRSFSSKHDRDRHEREVHGAEGSKAGSMGRALIPCPVVSCKRHARGFARKENLALHMRNMHPQGVASGRSLAALSSQPSQTASTLSSPATAALPFPTTPASSTGSGCAPADTLLLTALQERLTTLHARRDALAAQMAGVDETIDVLTRAVHGIQAEQSWPPAAELCDWENWDWMTL